MKGVNEIQVLVCKANNGTFQLKFRGNYSDHIPYNSSADEFRFYLKQMYT